MDLIPSQLEQELKLIADFKLVQSCFCRAIYTTSANIDLEEEKKFELVFFRSSQKNLKQVCRKKDAVMLLEDNFLEGNARTVQFGVRTESNQNRSILKN